MADIADDIRALRSFVDQALQRARAISGERPVPASRDPGCLVIRDPTEDSTDPISQLLVDLDRADRAAAGLFERLCAGPSFRHLGGHLLSREEFYLQATHEVVSVKTPWGEAYEVFRMYCYEDSRRRCYINPDEKPHVRGQMRIRCGIPPEEISWEGLRPEQRSFFTLHFPEVAARFKREA